MTSNEFFKGAKNVLKKTTKKVVKFSGDAVDYAKIKIKLNAVESELEELYAKIGRIVYERDESQDTDEICKAIEELNAQKDELKAKMESYNINSTH